MAIPGGYSRASMTAVYSGDPAPYQVDFYLNAVSASTNQKAAIQTWRAGKGKHWLNPEEIEWFLTNNS